MFGLFRKKNGVTEDVVFKLMPATGGDFEGLRFADDVPQDLYKISDVQNTMRGQSTQSCLVPCRDTVRALRVQIRKHQAEVYYVTPRPFPLEHVDETGTRMRHTVVCDTKATSFAGWLQMHVRKPGENIGTATLSEWWKGRKLPDWLTVSGSEQIAEPEPQPEPEKGGTEALAPGAVVMGRYRIERELGQGGMGKVFLATDDMTTLATRRHVVLKVLHMEDAHDVKAQERFKKEAATLSGLSHGNIAAYYDSFMFGDVPILVMEYVEGVSLDRYLEERRDGILDEATTRELLRPIAEALDYAHQRKIYHLDVKPQNIIVRTTPKLGRRTCLVDFGIARKTQVGGMQTFTMMNTVGTPQYMSPDQYMNEVPCAAMDVYSLAVTAYECMTGKMPYPSGWKRTVVVPPIGPDTPFTHAVMRGLDGLPEKRPATCLCLIDPPCSAVEPEPVQPKPVPVPEADKRPSPPLQPEKAKEAPHADLRKTIANYRTMLAQSANKAERDDPERAAWLRGRQAQLRDITRNFAQVNERVLVDFFGTVRKHLKEAGASPEEFFAATDRLVELRAGLPQDGGAVWSAISKSVNMEAEGNNED